MTERPPAPADRGEAPSQAAPHEDARREPHFVLARFERHALPWLAARLPAWVMPDHLTLLGILSAFGIGGAYLLSNHDPAWLWMANVLLVVHWFGDSLDGSLARFRRTERPRYGYYLDHTTDALATVVIGVGLGLSPYMLVSTGLSVVIAYLVLSINLYLETYVFGVFKLGYNYVGPTEARVVLFIINALVAAGVGVDFRWTELELTLLDILGIAASALMTVLLAGRVIANLRQLAEHEPSRRTRSS